VHTIELEPGARGRFVRVAIPAHGLGTGYGASLWAVKVFGQFTDHGVSSNVVQ
jgi:hypothetical protein